MPKRNRPSSRRHLLDRSLHALKFTEAYLPYYSLSYQMLPPCQLGLNAI